MEEPITAAAAAADDDDDDILITLRGGGSGGEGAEDEDSGGGCGTTTGAAAATDGLRAGAPDERQRRQRPQNEKHDEDNATTTTTTTSTMILRVRAPDGSLQRLQLTETIRQWTIVELLENLQIIVPPVPTTTGNNNNKTSSSFTVQLDGMAVASSSLRIADLPRLKHGSVLAVVTSEEKKTPLTKVRNADDDDAEADATGKKTPPSSFVPFPDLAKRWNDRRYRANKNNKPTSYAALTAYRDATVHRIEEVSQPKRIEQVYICPNMARRFVEMDRGGTDNDNDKDEAAVLILGTLARQHQTKARHSLDDQKTMHKSTLIAKSQAMVVPSEEKDDVWKDVAMYLGLEPIGWMVAAAVTTTPAAGQKKNTDEKSSSSLLPTNTAILRAARFQIDVMRQKAQQRPRRPDEPGTTSTTTTNNFEGFCTIAMDRSSGATEAYQLTDVTVQMVAEGLFHETTTTNTFDAKKKKRADKNDNNQNNNNILRTKHPIWVDGGESNSLDTLLCLVNTAVLSHTGWYSTKTTRTVKKTNGRLTKVTRTKLLAALQRPKGQVAAAGNGENNNGDAAALDILCDFDLLVALVRMLRSTSPNKNQHDDNDDGRELCETVQQYAKGLKRTTKLNPALRQRIVDLIQSDVA